MRVRGVLVVCAANRRLGGAKGVDDQPAGVVGPAHRPISLKSSTGSSLTVRTGRGCWTVFSTLTRPLCYKLAGHLKSAKSCDASGLTTLPVWIS